MPDNQEPKELNISAHIQPEEEKPINILCKDGGRMHEIRMDNRECIHCDKYFPTKELEQKGDLSGKLCECPFCGEEINLYLYNDGNEKLTHYNIRCMECGADGSVTADKRFAEELWNTRAPSKNEDPEGLIHSYVVSRKLANKMNVAVTLHYEGHDYTVKPMRLGEKVNKLKEQLTTTQQALDSAVEALRIIAQSKLHMTDRLDAALLFCELLQTQAKETLASIKE